MPYRIVEGASLSEACDIMYVQVVTSGKQNLTEEIHVTCMKPVLCRIKALANIFVAAVPHNTSD